MLDRFNKSTRIIIAAALAVLIWVTGVIIGQEQTITILNPEGGLKSLITRTQTIKVSLMVDWGNGRIKVFPETTLNYGGSVLELLDKLNLLPDSGLDLQYRLDQKTGELTGFSVGGYRSLQGGKQWLLWLNNVLQTRPVNEVRLRASDVIELKYIKLAE